MSEREWRQSGLDGFSHGFRAEGGCVPSADRHVSEETDPVECLISECGEVLPLAFVMHHDGGQRCAACARLTCLSGS
ncbi:hypothetical protein SAMN04487904_102420 [Actinopolyspora lacussalsi subsp. righensis]|uniref:Uncharacterized protein n=1 Tax=Actinopolyspora righensis TaxID=995060 RepID=A0A1I6YD25_9ACTN|nr:hypothetical protein [Actinopolyspora righensis]SFT48290.1 hypothetical protein SAMN04487904_102420 [Actinopolyspora righensis]